MTTRPASFVTLEATAQRSLHAVPVDQPKSIHQLAPGLLEAYEAAGGQLHLAAISAERGLMPSFAQSLNNLEIFLYGGIGERVCPNGLQPF